MPAEAVAEVDAGEEVCGAAIGLFRETAGEAADAADDHREDQGIGEEIAGRLFFSQQLLGELDTEEAAEEGADDGFIGIEIEQRMLRTQEGRRVFEGADQPGEEECAEGGADDDPDAVRAGRSYIKIGELPNDHQRVFFELWRFAGELVAQIELLEGALLPVPFFFAARACRKTSPVLI